MAMLGTASMTGVPALGLPKINSLVGSIFIPTLAASALWSISANKVTPFVQHPLEPFHRLVYRVIAGQVDHSRAFTDVMVISLPFSGCERNRAWVEVSPGTPPPCIQREASRAQQRNRNQPQQHAEVGASFVHRRPESLFEQHRNLRGGNGDRNIDEQGHGGKGRKEAGNQKRAAANLHHANERPGELRNGNTDLRKASRAEGGREEKFLNAFGKEDPADEEPQQ